jgi:hypothetical protein
MVRCISCSVKTLVLTWIIEISTHIGNTLHCPFRSYINSSWNLINLIWFLFLKYFFETYLYFARDFLYTSSDWLFFHYKIGFNIMSTWLYPIKFKVLKDLKGCWCLKHEEEEITHLWLLQFKAKFFPCCRLNFWASYSLSGS